MVKNPQVISPGNQFLPERGTWGFSVTKNLPGKSPSFCHQVNFLRHEKYYLGGLPGGPKGNPMCPLVYGVKVLLGPLMNGDGRFTTQRFQSTLLHEEIPVTRVELMDLLCDQFKLPKNLQTYNRFENLSFFFGQKFTTSSGTDFWTTG